MYRLQDFDVFYYIFFIKCKFPFGFFFLLVNSVIILWIQILYIWRKIIGKYFPGINATNRTKLRLIWYLGSVITHNWIHYGLKKTSWSTTQMKGRLTASLYNCESQFCPAYIQKVLRNRRNNTTPSCHFWVQSSP